MSEGAGGRRGASNIVTTAVQTATGRAARGLGHALEAWLDAERHQLPLWLPVALGAGIAAYFGLSFVEQWRAALAAGVALAFAGLSVAGLAGRSLLWFGLLFALGVGLAWLRAENAGGPNPTAKLFNPRFEATVVESENLVARERFRLLLAPSDPAFPRLVRVTLRHAPPEGVRPGARVALRAALEQPAGPAVPGGYDFAFRAWFQGIGATGYALGEVALLAPAPPAHGIAARFDAFRDRLTRRIQSTVGGAEGAVSAALVTGDRDAIPERVNDDMRDAGLAHLLSISGLHIAVVIGGMMWTVRKLLCLSPWIALRWPVKAIAALVAALAGIAYTVLAGAEVPTVRSCLAAIVVLAGLTLGRQAISLRVVAVAALLILAVRPEVLMNPSFQLSFGAIVSIVALYESSLGERLLKRRGEWGWPMRLAHGLFALLATGLAAELALMPIALHHFGRNGVYGVLANLIAIPLSSFVVMPALVLALLLDLAGLAAPAWWAVRESVGLVLRLAAEVASWPGAVWRVPMMPGAAFALFIAGGLWLMLWRSRARLAGITCLLAAALLTLTARPPDLLISGDGRHAGVVTKWGRLALLRDRTGGFIEDMWGDATAAGATVRMSESIGRCTADACLVRLNRGGREWTIVATRSPRLLDRTSFALSCARSDILVSDRSLPAWCQPRWLKLDRAALRTRGAMAIWLDPLRVATAADGAGDHPWAAWARATPQWYRRSSPTSRPWTRTRDGR